MPEPIRVWIGDDGRQELHGIHSVNLGGTDDDWIEGYGTGEMCGLLAMLVKPQLPTPVELALIVLCPHLAVCPLYAD
ncbi:hypothetical protein OG548_25575 [Streptomyces sp. NBC_01356]|uniref:hypothetical protein n=1 Tax=Streptomyces sp. NBC_01356 TaxID=2903836 RepID=UPI002E36352A|nr:hypothetical protein [Streptomyces sp. NBC_01356]